MPSDPVLGVLLLSGAHDRAHYAFVVTAGAAALGREVILFATNLVDSGPPRLWMRSQWAEGTPWVKWTPVPLTGASTTRPVEGPALTAYGSELVLSVRESGTRNIYVVTQKSNDPTTAAGWSRAYLKF